MNHNDQNINRLHIVLILLANCSLLEEDGPQVAEKSFVDDWKLI